MSQAPDSPLNSHEITLIKSCIPVLKQHGQEITTCFYTILLKEHPELLNVFNHSNQREGLQQQALASALYAVAYHITHLENILPTVKQIAYKHVSLGVTPEQYPLVGSALIQAMHTVLGNLFTPELEAAWGKTYALIADVFIQSEQTLYDQGQQQSGGWSGFRQFTVTQKIIEGQDIVSLSLKPADAQPIATFRSGQYITIKVHINGYDHLRQYSLSTSNDQPFYRITAKRENGNANEAGIVSNYLHDHVEEGDILLVSIPCGTFTQNVFETNPIVYLAAGIGITPLLSMLHELHDHAPMRPAKLAYAIKNGQFHAFKQEIQTLVQSTPSLSSATFYERPQADDIEGTDYDFAGLISEEWLQESVPSNADIYICGPRIFMQTMVLNLLEQGHSLDRIHYEVFGPALSFVY